MNFLFPVDNGPSTVRYLGFEEKVPVVFKSEKKYVRVNHYRFMTIGNVYQSERQDRISYYIRDDRGELCEVNKKHFEDITEVRNKRLKKIGI